MPLTLQVFDTAQYFIQAIEHAQAMVDNAPMNLVIGAAHDFHASQKPPSTQKSIWMVLNGEHSGGVETIQASLDPSLSSQTSICMALCSHNLETYYIAMPENDPRVLSDASRIIESMIHALTAAKVPPIRSAFGPKVLVDILLGRWSSLVDPALVIRENAFITTHLAYLTPSEYEATQQRQNESGQDSGYEVLDLTSLAYGRDSLEIKTIHTQLVHCILAFWGSVSEEDGSNAAESMINQVLDSADAGTGRLWVCRPKGEDETSKTTVAGYLYAGRETRNTIGIRNVYTKDVHRGQGVARKLVTAVSRWWLLETDGEKKKQAVVLFVEPENVAATRTYLRSGFRIEEETWERRGFDGVSMGAF